MQVNFPDPFLLETRKGIYAYATNSGGVHVQIAYSPDLLHWALLRRGDKARTQVDALPRLPAWVRSDHPDVWAPEVTKVGERYVLYFTARSRTWAAPHNLRECIGAATSREPDQPFTALDEPIVCHEFRSGVIDPDPFRDGHRLYLFYKRDGNCCGRGSGLIVQDLSADGLKVTGAPIHLGVTNSQPWEGKVVEAPTMFEHRSRYYLFFSGAYYGGANYAIGYADCPSPTGPCQESPRNPILKSRLNGQPRVIGPGHQSILAYRGRTIIAYHAWQVLPGGSQGPARFMHLGEIIWVNGEPHIQPLRARF